MKDFFGKVSIILHLVFFGIFIYATSNKRKNMKSLKKLISALMATALISLATIECQAQVKPQVVQQEVKTNSPRFVLPVDVTVSFTVTGDTEFTVVAPVLSANYALQASEDGAKWFNTGFTFGPSSAFQSVSFSVYGTGPLQFRLRRI